LSVFIPFSSFIYPHQLLKSTFSFKAGVVVYLSHANGKSTFALF